MRGPDVRWCWVFAVAVLLAGCRRREPKVALARPNVLLITLDTTRADRLGCYGFGPARTPHLDRLAREGVRVADALSAAPITAPSHATLLTGLNPPTHGVRDNGSYRLSDEIVTLPERLREAGYDTSAFVSATVLSKRYNLSQGFEVYDDDLWSEDAPDLFMIRERSGARTAERAVAWLDARVAKGARQPFFQWVHFFDVHQPHDSRTGAAGQLAASPYDAEIAGVDGHVGQLIEALRARKLLDSTLVIVTADHGESLGEHGEATHAVFVYASTIRVPLLFRYPAALPQGKVFASTVHGVDVFPTVLAATGVAARGAVDGRNVWKALQGREALKDTVHYSESLLSELGFGMAPLFALRDARYTYVRAPRPELYDRRGDPGEKVNLAAAQPEQLRRMDAALSGVLTAAEQHAHPVVRHAVDKDTMEQLQALGYLGDPATRDAVTGMDPKDGIEIHEAMHAARSLVRGRRWVEARDALKRVLAATPRNVTALNTLGLVAWRQGSAEEARKVYQESLGVDAQQHRVLLQLGLIDLDAGQLERAAQEIDQALTMAPGFVEGMIGRGMIEVARNNLAGAETHYQKAMKEEPSYPRGLQVFGDLLFRRGRYAEALGYYKRVIELAPQGFDALNQAGACARRVGDQAGALQYYARAQAVRPDSWIPPYNIACVQALAGEAELARAALRSAKERGLDLRMASADPDLASLRPLKL